MKTCSLLGQRHKKNRRWAVITNVPRVLFIKNGEPWPRLKESNLCALSVSPSCLIFRENGIWPFFRPNPAFMPKIITSPFKSRVITLNGLFPLPLRNEQEAEYHNFCLQETSTFSWTPLVLSLPNDQLREHYTCTHIGCRQPHSTSPLKLFVWTSNCDGLCVPCQQTYYCLSFI